MSQSKSSLTLGPYNLEELFLLFHHLKLLICLLFLNACAAIVAALSNSSYVSLFHNLMVLSFSRAADAMMFSVGWHAVHRTVSVWP